jgi:hypothetical protein
LVIMEFRGKAEPANPKNGVFLVICQSASKDFSFKSPLELKRITESVSYKLKERRATGSRPLPGRGTLLAHILGRGRIPHAHSRKERPFRAPEDCREHGSLPVRQFPAPYRTNYPLQVRSSSDLPAWTHLLECNRKQR